MPKYITEIRLGKELKTGERSNITKTFVHDSLEEREAFILGAQTTRPYGEDTDIMTFIPLDICKDNQDRTSFPDCNDDKYTQWFNILDFLNGDKKKRDDYAKEEKLYESLCSGYHAIRSREIACTIERLVEIDSALFKEAIKKYYYNKFGILKWYGTPLEKIGIFTFD